MTTKTLYVCGQCGRINQGGIDDNLDDWLVAPRPGHPGEMVIRCQSHITEHAIRKAGGHIENGDGVVGAYRYTLSK